MYNLVLTVHSLLRWAVVVLAVWAIARAWTGVATRRAWTPLDDSAGRWYAMILDIQVLLGLLLYGVLSPVTMQALSDMGAAMRDPILRFWAVEHVALMLIALVVAHIGRVRARRAANDAARHRAAAIFHTMSFVCLLAALPWPFMAAGRPLLRFGS
jgi:uncharacterized membrane protein YozB (DUF420 family)